MKHDTFNIALDDRLNGGSAIYVKWSYKQHCYGLVQLKVF